MKIVLATKNTDKIAEINKILKDFPVETVTAAELGAPEVAEDGRTFFENARKKAYETAMFTRLPSLADDTGLCVDALGGRPGVFSSRYAGRKATYESNVRKLLREMSGRTDRKAKFVCVCVLHFPDGQIFSTRGETEGVIARETFGDGGFGYDPVFLIPRLRKTFADMFAGEKNALSHRGKAFREMGKIIERLAAPAEGAKH